MKVRFLTYLMASEKWIAIDNKSWDLRERYSLEEQKVFKKMLETVPIEDL